jgi:hypothetical protein
MTVGVALRALPPITLDELVQRASLLVRMERKYLLDPADLVPVLAGLSADVRVLEIDGRREFGYHSLYLDTPDLDCYLAAAYGRRHRFKVRVRGYLESGLRFLEVKTRGRRGETVKHRVPYFGEDPGLAHLLVSAGVATDPRRLVASLNVSYRRTTLFLPSSNARMSIDSGLRWALPGGFGVTPSDLTVVETKSAGVTPADRMLWSLGHRPYSVSKYCVGLATVRPDLPANRWRCVLRRHVRTVAEVAAPR